MLVRTESRGSHSSWPEAYLELRREELRRLGEVARRQELIYRDVPVLRRAGWAQPVVAGRSNWFHAMEHV